MRQLSGYITKFLAIMRQNDMSYVVSCHRVPLLSRLPPSPTPICVVALRGAKARAVGLSWLSSRRFAAHLGLVIEPFLLFEQPP
jgi:hypothetical protein